MSVSIEPCTHAEFLATVQVNGLEDTRIGANLRCMIDLSICCASCHEPLLFALPVGVNFAHGATMSLDGTEARLTARIGIPAEGKIVGFGLSWESEQGDVHG